MGAVEEDIQDALKKGEKVFIVMGDNFFKASLSGPDLKLSLLIMSHDEVLSEVKHRLHPDWC